VREHKMTAWEAGNDLAACCDYLGDKEEDAAKSGFEGHAALLRSVRMRLANYFNKHHAKTHDFGLGPTKKRKSL
jgi:hypothetical protein